MRLNNCGGGSGGGGGSSYLHPRVVNHQSSTYGGNDGIVRLTVSAENPPPAPPVTGAVDCA